MQSDPSSSPPADASTAAAWLAASRALCVSTGAGMSAESGLATFRDVDGLWSKFNPAELATPEAFLRDPCKVWEWYRLRRARLAQIEPHDGHRLLAAWEARIPDFTLVTQNVDGLHHRAGSRRVLELHGRLDTARCIACPFQIVGLDDLGEDPRCTECGQRLRPGVVWFGEALPQSQLAAAFDAAERCDVMLVIGTSGVVQPAASLVDTALQHGARLIEINPHPSAFSGSADAFLRCTALSGLREIERHRP
ncbi:MAG: NAD-dependent protein deacylase [Phycisphaerae bacterium]|nr:NAD-dependent protein deacylase [Phycisphaerae bacterium]